jgi:hypothetical protein
MYLTGKWSFLIFASAALLCSVAVHAQSAGKTAEEFVYASTAGGPSAAVPLYHPKEVTRLHDKIMLGVEREAQTGGKSIRTLLFGGGPSVEDLRHMTHEAMLLAVLARMPTKQTVYDEFKSLGEVKEVDNLHIVVRASLSKVERLKRRSIVTVVTLIPDGKAWRAAIPSFLEARVDDALAAGPQDIATETATVKPLIKDPAWQSLLTKGIAILQQGNCERYFSEIMAPSFRQSLAPKAYDTIVKSCDNNSQGIRDKFRTGLELARDRDPSLEGDGSRVVYDLKREGLPYDKLVLTRIAGQWYVAE